MDINKIRRCVAAVLIDDYFEDQPKKAKTRDWIKRREERGAYVNIINELGAEDSVAYKKMMRMDHSTFCTILRYIEKDITPNELASGLKVIRALEHLVLAIRYFATGETFRSLSFQ